MPATDNTFRVFVSSTFSDLTAERNALARHVFPRLRDLCASYGGRFMAVDLRWGVSEEAGLDQRTMRVCLGEIARCQELSPRPNFLVLLGDRYGWQPLPEEIPSDVFRAIAAQVAEPDMRRLLESWYREDLNGRPPVHVLQPRDRNSEFADYGVWQREVEWPLRQALVGAAAGAGLPSDVRMSFDASATHQEILRGALGPDVHAAEEHVCAVLRHIVNLDDVVAALPDGGARRFLDTDPDGGFDESAHRRLLDLEEQLRLRLGTRVTDYDAHWAEGEATRDHLGALPPALDACLPFLDLSSPPAHLCEAVWRALGTVIRRQAEDRKERSPVSVAADSHARFAEERSQGFVGRHDILSRIDAFVEGEDDQPLVVHGPSGCGKSALLACAVRSLRGRGGRSTPAPMVIERYIGATPGSTSLVLLLRDLCATLYETLDLEENRRAELEQARAIENERDRERRLDRVNERFATPDSLDKLAAAFPRFLAHVPDGRSLVLVLDAVDQLEPADSAHSLWWLPARLPARVKVVLSTLPDPYPCLESLRPRLDATRFTEVRPLSRDDGATALDGWLATSGRTLTDGQREEVLDRFGDCRLPIYLRLGFVEASRWRSYDGVPGYRGHRGLSPDVHGLIRDMLERLGREVNHGKVLVQTSLSLLASARHGLSEDELLDLLSADEAVRADFARRSFHDAPEARLPAVIWSRLHQDLAPYLSERDAGGASLLSFFHRQLAEVIREDWGDGASRRQRHVQIARFFRDAPSFHDPAQRTVPNARKTAELPWQLHRAGLYEELGGTLTDLEFIEAKCSAGQTNDLSRDMRDALRDGPHDEARWPGRTKVAGTARFVERHAHELQRHPQQTFQLAANEPDATAAADLARVAGRRRRTPAIWVRWVNKPQVESPRIRTLAGHSAGVNGAAFSPDGHRILTFSGDATARTWATETGEILHVLVGHEKPITNAVFAAGGRRIATLGRDDALVLWDAESGGRLSRHAIVPLRDFRAQRSIPVFAPDGTWLIALPGPDRIAVLAAEDGRRSAELVGHTDRINHIAISPGGRTIVTASEDHTVRVWDPRTGAPIHVLTEHEGPVAEVIFSGDGRSVVSTSDDGKIRIWNTRTWNAEAHVGGLPRRAGCLAISHRGDLVVFRPAPKNTTVTSYVQGTRFTPEQVEKRKAEHCLDVWLTTRGRAHKLSGHLGNPAVPLFPGRGSLLLSSGQDGLLQAWDASLGEGESILSGPLDVTWRYSCTSNGAIVAATAKTEWAMVDLRSRQLLCRVPAPLCGAFDPSISGDGRHLLTSSPGNGVTLWDLEEARLRGVPAPDESPSAIQCISRDGGVLLHRPESDKLATWDVDAGRELAVFERRGAPFVDMAISDDRRLVAFPHGNEITVRNVADLTEVSMVAGSRWFTRHLAFTPDGGRLAGIDADGVLRLWDVATGLFLNKYREPRGAREMGSTGGVRIDMMISGGQQSVACIFPPDGRATYMAYKSNGLTELAPDSLGPRRRLAEYGGMRPNESSHTIDVSGRKQRVGEAYEKLLRIAACSPDGRILAGAYDDALKLWDRFSGEELAHRAYERPKLQAIAFSPDARRLAVALADRSIRLLDVASLDEVASIFDRPAKMLAFRAGGRELIAGEDLVHLEWMGVQHEAPYVVAHEDDRAPGAGSRFRCPSCGMESGVPAGVATALAAWDAELDMTATREPPRLAEALNDPVLELACTACDEVLRLAPFLRRGTPLTGQLLADAQRRTEEERIRREAEEHDEKERWDKEKRLPELHRKTVAAFQAGRRDEAIAYAREHERLCRELENSRGLQWVLGVLGALTTEGGDGEQGLSLLEEQSMLCEQLGLKDELLESFANRSVCLWNLERFQQGLELLDRWESLALEASKTKSLLLCHARRGQVLEKLGRLDEAIATYRQREERAREQGEGGAVRDSLFQRGRLLVAANRHRAALRPLEQASSAHAEAGDHAGLVRSLLQSWIALNRLGQPDREVSVLERMESAAKAAGNRYEEARAMGNRGAVLDRLGKGEEALRLFVRQEPILRELGRQKEIQRCLANQQAVASKHTADPGVQALLRAREGQLRSAGDNTALAGALLQKAAAHKQRGDAAGALRVLLEAEQVCRNSGDDASLHRCLADQGALLAPMGRRDEALPKFEEQAAICEKIGDAVGLAGALGNKGLILAGKGQVDEALRLLAQQEPVFRQHGQTVHLGYSLLNQALFEIRRRRHAVARPKLEEATKIFQANAIPDGQRKCANLMRDLQRLEAAAGGRPGVRMVRRKPPRG